MPRLRALLLISVLALAGRDARADAPARTSSLGWVRMPGAEPCIGPRELAEAVERRLGHAVFVSPSKAEVHVEARIEPIHDGAASGPKPRPGGAGPTPLPDPNDAPPGDLPPLAPSSGFRAHINITDARGEVLGTRELWAPGASCRTLDEQLSLVIALLIDPDAALAPRAPPRAPAPPRRVIVERIITPDPAPAPPPPSEPWRGHLSAGVSVSAGLVPRAGIALSLRGEIVPPSFIPIEVGADLTRDTSALAPGSATQGATLSLAYGMIGLCPLVWDRAATRVRGCADLGVGSVRSTGYGFTSVNGAGQEQAIAHAMLAGRVSRRLIGPLEIRLGLALVVPFRRARFYYLDTTGGEQEIYRMAPVAGVVEAGLGLSFP